MDALSAIDGWTGKPFIRVPAILQKTGKPQKTMGKFGYPHVHLMKGNGIFRENERPARGVQRSESSSSVWKNAG
jgi:hypothetical protein